MSITAIAIAMAAIIMSALWDYAALVAVPCLAIGLIPLNSRLGLEHQAR